MQSESTIDRTQQIDWLRCVPFLLLHLACLAVFWVGVSPVAVALAVFLYVARMFFITGFYHRYFSHRSFRAPRWVAFLGAAGGCSAAQRGPIWWSAQHRHHHQHSDRSEDKHSPRTRGFWFSHVGWFLTREGYETDARLVRDWLRYPELRWLERFEWVPFALLGAGVFALGALAETRAPALGTTGPQLLVWFLISTIVLYHVTYTVNSIAHRFGSQRFPTGDDSRNNALLAVLTLGEGWHNNHHHYPASARQGFYWWEIDVCYWMLRGLAALRLISHLRPVPARVLREGRLSSGVARPESELS